MTSFKEENQMEKFTLTIPLKHKYKVTMWVVAVILVIAIAAAAYFYIQLGELKRNPQKVAEVEAQEVIAKVSRLIILPEGETPTVATVTDPERLKDQPFFQRAKVGYKVLIYTNARKAILYDPEQDKIAEVASLNIGEPR